MWLACKPDYEKTLERFEAWWQGELIDRPPVFLHTRPDRTPQPMPQKEHATHRDRWMDGGFLLERFEASLTHDAWVGDAAPIFMPNLGPDICAALFGCDITFGERTSWSVPNCGAIAELLQRRPDFDNEYWRWIRDMTDASLSRGDGRWITGITDLHTNADLVAAMRDPQELCFDMADDLEAAAAAVEHVTSYFKQVYEDLYSRIAASGQPATTWMRFLHAGSAYAVNCDFICMISPEMFERAVLPSLVAEMRSLDRSIFHLDGPDALRHLDRLLEVPELHAVQWVYGAGNGPATRWIDVYRRIQAAGKGVQVIAGDLAEARAVAEQIRPEGAWFHIGGSYSRDDAEAFLQEMERWASTGTI